MALRRPRGFLESSKVKKVIEKSIDAVIEWGEKTQDAFYDSDQRVEELNELMNIVCELTWRYGNEHVRFKFSQKKKFDDAFFPVSELIDTEDWADRVHVSENFINEISIVYINF